MELHEEIRRARKDLGLSQERLAELCGIQRRQLSILERGGNVTLNTLRKVIAFLPNLEEFTFEQVRMKPSYIDYPPFEWSLFYANMYGFQKALEDMSTALKAWLDSPPANDVDPDIVARRTTNLATEMVKAYAQVIDPEGAELKSEEEALQREEEKKAEQKRRRAERKRIKAEIAERQEYLAMLRAEGVLGEDEELEEEEAE